MQLSAAFRGNIYPLLEIGFLRKVEFLKFDRHKLAQLNATIYFSVVNFPITSSIFLAKWNRIFQSHLEKIVIRGGFVVNVVKVLLAKCRTKGRKYYFQLRKPNKVKIVYKKRLRLTTDMVARWFRERKCG